MINARAESVLEKEAFRDSVKRRRCLIPADGFYEWKKLDGRTKQPYCFMLTDESVFAFAGIWSRWIDPSTQQPVETCSILTTTPNAITSDVHDRMPVILRPEDYELWLDPGFTREEGVVELLKPFEGGRMKKFPVSARVNSVQNDDAGCSEPINEGEDKQGSLFATGD